MNLVLAQLLHPHPSVEGACQTLLNTVLPTFLPRTAETVPASRIEVEFAQNAWTGRWLPDSKNNLHHSAWRCTLTIRIHAERVREDPPVKDQVPLWAAAIKAKLESAINRPDFLPWHTIVELNERAATESVDNMEDGDVMAIVYDGYITVRSDAMRRV